MGTTYTVKIVSDRPIVAHQIQFQIDNRLKDINQVMSTYIEDSEISQLNQNQSTKPMTISTELMQLLVESLRISKNTNGAFDITVGPLVNLWGFGPIKSKDIPSQVKINQVLQYVGYNKLLVDPVTKSITKMHPQVSIDLSANAKGYGVDQVSLLLKELGYKDFMVEIGGEVCAFGKNPDHNFWRIGIETPREGLIKSVYKSIELINQCMATSGNYRNFYTAKGHRYSHTLSAQTGRPVTNNVLSVSVLHSSCSQADAYATALMTLPPKELEKMAIKLDLAVLYIYDDKSEMKYKATGPFPKVNPSL